jgi:uncharacterized protein (TIRG00374 family)
MYMRLGIIQMPSNPLEQTREIISNRWPAIWLAAKISLALGLAYILISSVSLSDIQSMGEQLYLPWLIPSILCYISYLYLSARRSWNLLLRSVPFNQVMWITSVQSVIGNFIATTAGITSYVALLRGRHQIGLTQSLGSIIISRLIDLFLITFVFIITMILSWKDVQSIHFYLIITTFIVVFSTIFATLILFWNKKIVQAIKPFNGHKNRILSGISTQISVIADKVSDIEPEKKRLFFRISITNSLAIFIVQALFGYCNMNLFGIDIAFHEMLFVMSTGLFISLIPIQVFGGLGVSEATNFYLYGLFVPNHAILIPFLLANRVYFYLLNLLIVPYVLFEPRLGNNAVQPPIASRDQ